MQFKVSFVGSIFKGFQNNQFTGSKTELQDRYKVKIFLEPGMRNSSPMFYRFPIRTVQGRKRPRNKD